MKETTKIGLQITYAMSFVIGCLLFLTGTRTTGESIESFNLIVLGNTIQIVGLILGVTALVALVILYFSQLKNILKHKTGYCLWCLKNL